MCDKVKLTFYFMVIFFSALTLKYVLYCHSNHVRSPNTHIIRFLERHGIPYHCLPTTPGNKREDEILELAADTDFLVLARYMQVR